MRACSTCHSGKSTTLEILYSDGITLPRTFPLFNPKHPYHPSLEVLIEKIA